MAPSNLDPVKVAIAEVKGMADMFKRIQDVCWNKCISSTKDAMLNPGEASCLDRCVFKYISVHQMTGKHLQEQSQA
ncbi:Mitochondrial import inner membrane translocase subunit Tim10 [Babesia microti strain RI]|uniref:Mitochondrial import inner membrane translocase subunit n=1 Tax=Babesia microti (strain RI) TaxID=1133968 RepID=A0A0K3AT77_BABMR|nr:Mitochondrial import inner membrane translocase subunit Tim10 [Babesia microti strain RI]CTQ40766.1 Mitochondrial import inner membrane translocase subunit Tim10 [Babesia microti strain RI]|eukprot:XP_012648777.1 Mitochondrial import inner membrane translocase subunit Tim10 [Babesia microti strain RI]